LIYKLFHSVGLCPFQGFGRYKNKKTFPFGNYGDSISITFLLRLSARFWGAILTIKLLLNRDVIYVKKYIYCPCNSSWSAVKLDLYGLKFFYTNILKKTV